MKAVILAANRNEPSIGAGPACLLEVDHKTVLEHQLESLVEAGIDEVAIVIGRDQEEIVRHVDSRNCPDGYVGPVVEFIRCAEPNRDDGYLLGLAREWIGDDPFIFLEAGTAFQTETIEAAEPVPANQSPDSGLPFAPPEIVRFALQMFFVLFVFASTS